MNHCKFKESTFQCICRRNCYILSLCTPSIACAKAFLFIQRTIWTHRRNSSIQVQTQRSDAVWRCYRNCCSSESDIFSQNLRTKLEKHPFFGKYTRKICSTSFKISTGMFRREYASNNFSHLTYTVYVAVCARISSTYLLWGVRNFFSADEESKEIKARKVGVFLMNLDFQRGKL